MTAELSIGQIALLGFGVVSASIVLVLVDKKRRSPEKSYKNHLTNMMLVIPRALGLGMFKKPLTLENAFKYATRKTGLSDFRGLGFAEDTRWFCRLPHRRAAIYQYWFHLCSH